MAKKLILHIGRHKSGTSSIQAALHQGAAAFEQQSTIYPISGRQMAGGRLVLSHFPLTQCLVASKHNPANWVRLARSLQREIANFETAVISDEALQNVRDPELLDRLFALFPDREITIVCYLREFLEYKISAFQQMVQNKPDDLNFKKFIRFDIPLQDFFTRWKKHGELSIRLFHRGALKDGDVVADFADVTGLPIKPLQSESNPSIGGNLLLYKLARNRLGEPQQDYRSYSQLALRKKEFSGRFYIGTNCQNRVRSKTQYNEVMRENVGKFDILDFSEFPMLMDEDNWISDIELCKDHMGDASSLDYLTKAARAVVHDINEFTNAG